MLRSVVILSLLATCCSVRPAGAANYDNCTGFIDSVPATITAPGIRCMRKDVSTANTGGNAITVNANNVSVECNDFKVNGVAAGDGSQASGVSAPQRQKVTVRHCGARGFKVGIVSQLGAGTRVEDNRLDNNLQYGTYVSGDNARILRNAIYVIGGATGGITAFGILATGDVVDNDIQGVLASGSPSCPTGIRASGYVLSGNRVAGLVVNGIGAAEGISADDNKTSALGNQVHAGVVAVAGLGIRGALLCANNPVGKFSTSYNCGSSTTSLP